MPSVVVWALAMVLMLMESVLLEVFSTTGWAAQTPIAIAVYLGLDRSFRSGGLILVALFAPVEWLVGGVFGVYSLGLAVVFFVMRILRPNIQTVWGVARGIVAAVAVPLHALVMLGALFMSGDAEGRLVSVIAWQMWMSIPLVVVVTLLVGRGFARLEQMRDSHRGRSGLEL